MKRRESRKENANEQIKMKNCYTKTAKGRTYPNSAGNIVSSSDNESDDDGNDYTACLECKHLWRLYKGKMNEVWLICDMCDGYFIPKCSPEVFDQNNDFYCTSCSAGEI